MSDSIDRVFVKAITTIRALSSRSNYGSLPRPPAESRIKLYGLYKQATEGNVDGIMPRPVGFNVEDEGAKKKWDAWKREAGLSKTEAKRQYISYLIETMRIYASSTAEAKELLGELEFLWDQIKDLQYTPDEEINSHIPVSCSPSFSQAYSDKNSFVTASNNQYRNNLQKIYSHSRRSTMLSVNDYINQQRSEGVIGTGPKSTYSLPVERVKIPPQELLHSSEHPNNSNIQEFKNWQSEVNMIIGKLAKELLNKNNNPLVRGNNDETYSSYNVKLLRRLVHVAKISGRTLIQILKQLSFQILSVAIILWLFKKNLSIKRTLVKHEATTKSENKTYMINLILNINESNWLVRLVSFLTRYLRII